MATSLRSDTDVLVRLADGDLTRLWRLVADGASAETALRDLLPAIVTEYGAAGATMAAEWYDQQREKVGASGRFVALPMDSEDRGAQSLIGWALNTATDDAALSSLISGGVQRRIADHVRYTIANNSVRDKAARGWQRVGVGSCKDGFCDMLIARGAVYSEASADFAAHDNCKCSAVPAWSGEPVPVKPYTPTLRNVSDADRSRVRDYLRTH